jgi:TolB-like protein/class 3 adenylate cyclase/Flp pilus assembly protein TadD
MPEVRKLAAILFADVVGYSRLMGQDEAGTARTVREHREAARPIVTGHGGRIVSTSGDGLLLEFPSVVAAVECAIAIQTNMAERNADTPEPKQILYRIGVNLGDVLIEGDDILGEGVNIAARLESICEPGGILISGAAYDHVRGKVEARFVDLGEKALKNIARPVRVHAVKSGGEDRPSAAFPISIPNQPDRPRLSIVVLPFENIGGDPEQEYFVDGVTESLTTDLSRAKGSFVIARNTAFTFKGKPIDVMKVGRELNVRYALEGSVQRRSDRVRVNVQLVDTESGHHLWAERFDKPVADLFDMQDEIVARVANQLRVELFSAEARRSEIAASPDSLDLLFQGTAWLNRGPTLENLTRARDFFERALALDPDSILGLVEIALADFLVAAYLFPEDRVMRLERAEAASLRALALAPESAIAHMSLGSVLGITNRPEQAIAELERTLALNPNPAIAQAAIGLCKVYVGRAEETEAHVKEALRLSPRDSSTSYWLMFVGVAKIFLGQNEEAVVWLGRSIEANRNNPMGHFLLAAVLADLDRMQEAQSAARAGLALNPQFTIAWFPSSSPTTLDLRARIVAGLRKAGVPEE